MVSLVFPTFNRLHTLKKVIDSYLSVKEYGEIIFIDDGSSDGTYEFLLHLQSELGDKYLKIVRHDRNLGLPAARNSGIKEAKFKYIMMGEDDVVLDKDYVSTLISELEKNNYDIIAGRILYKRRGESFEDTLARCNREKGPFINYWLMSAFYSRPLKENRLVPFLHSIALGRTDVYKKISYDTSYHAREETDFYLRVTESGYRVAFTPFAHCFHLEPDKGRGGGWSMGLLRYQAIAVRNNNSLVERHYDTLKKWGMRGNKFTFKFLHFINRGRIVLKYLRTSISHK